MMCRRIAGGWVGIVSAARWCCALLLLAPALVSSSVQHNPGALAVGKSTHQILQRDRDGEIVKRHFDLWVLDGERRVKPTALVICLHGWTQTSEYACKHFCRPYAERFGYLSACPQGLGVATNWCKLPTKACKDAGTTGWNTNNKKGTFPRKWDADDVGFVKDMIDYLDTRVQIPPGRIFAMGFSFGGAMTFRLSCELSNYLYGFGVAGISWAGDFKAGDQTAGDTAGVGADWRGPLDDCKQKPEYRRPLISFGGTRDRWFPGFQIYDGWKLYAENVLRCRQKYDEVTYLSASAKVCETERECVRARV